MDVIFLFLFLFFLCSSLAEGGGRCFPSQDGSSNCALGYSNSIIITFSQKHIFLLQPNSRARREKILIENR